MKNVTKPFKVLMVFLLSIFLMSATTSAQTTLLQEGFETGAIPVGWTQNFVAGTTNWVFNSVGGYLGTPATTHSGLYNARFNYSGYGQKTEVITPAINFSGYTGGQLKFWHAQAYWAGDQDSLTVLYRETGAAAWKKLAIYVNNIAAWTEETIILPNLSATYQISFRGCAEYGYGVCLDDILVTGTAGPPPPATVTIGTGTTSSAYPYYTYWMAARTQMLYTAAEITAAGGAAGLISTLGFNVISNSTQVMNQFNVRMKNTTATSLTGWVPDNTFATVYTGTYTVPGTGWQMITLQNPFIWDGSNLLIEICFTNTAYTSSSPVYASTTTGKTWGYYMDNVTGCGNTNGSAVAYRPNLRFVVQPYVGTLSGIVRNNYNSLPLAGATVACGSLPPVVTGPTGTYAFNNVPIGTYNVNCSAPGFTTQIQPATVANNATTTLNFFLDPIPGVLTGVVTNCANGNPIVGAKVSFGSNTTYSVAGGVYTLNVYPVGTNPVSALKSGYVNYTSAPVTLTAGVTTTHNICMLEGLNTPSQPFTATLNGAATQVDLSWGTPVGQYEILYDDGIPENFTVWSTAGNMNAVKFTPISYPVNVIAGKINIGVRDNYPTATTLPLTAFQMAIYDATGTNGMPGQVIAGPIDVAANAYGWIEFNFPTPTTIASGNFYLVMIQGGVPPQAAGIAVDETSPTLRSYARFVTGSGPWIPASGNFLMRAICVGQGGPLLLDASNQPTITATAVPGAIYQHTPETVTGVEGQGQIIYLDAPDAITGYQVWRLHQGEELTPGVWTGVVGPIAATTAVDPAWPTLPDGAYLWAVKAQYTGNRWSEAIFSNVLGKNWTADVTVTVDLSCDAMPPTGALVTFTNLAYPTTYVYTANCPATGIVNFPAVWKGTYKLDVTKFAYTSYTLNPVTIMTTPLSFTVMLLEEKAKPRHLFVNDRTLLATWDKPRFEKEIWKETFVSGSLTTNQWTTSDAHWAIATGTGNPAPSVMWNYSPQVTGYDSYLTSKNLPTENAGTLLVQYDIFLDNFGNSTLEQMAIEVWNGTSWIAKRTWDNSSGANIPWTTDVVNISTEVGTQPNAKIRFHAFGEDSFSIDYWYLDNITLLGASANAEQCILGYNFYLNNTLMAYTPDTSYQIPPSQVHYGWLYEATVKAIYGAGYSDTARYVFTAHFLYPPINLTGVGIEDVAYLTWEKPIAYDGPALDQTRPAATGTGPASETGVGNSQGLDMTYITSNATDALFDNGPFNNSPGTGAGGADESVLQTGLTLYGSNMNQALGYTMADDFVVPAGGGWDPTKFIFFGYQTNSPSSGTFTGAFFRIYNGPPNAGGTVVWGDLTTNRMTTQAFSNCYRVQTVAGGTARAIIRIECNISGLHLAPGTYWVEVQTTGSGASGPWANPITINGTLATGNGLQWTGTAWNQWLDGSYQQGLPFIIEGPGGGGTPPGLVGYNIYRDGPFLHFVDDPDVLEYYDLGLNPGTYIYNITAKYDLTPYGFPGLFDESLQEGPDTVIINYGRYLPFYEPWDQGAFAFNEWRFEPVQSNWNMNTGFGNPAPSADFNWQPMITNYESNLETPVLNAIQYQCANVWLDFDWKLVNRNATGEEKLEVGIYYDGSWHKLKEFINDNSYDWTAEHIDISVAVSKAFRIGFKAHGENSADILHWYVDNINVYGICKAPEDLAIDVDDNDVYLNWNPPTCGPSGVLKKLFQWEGTPDNGYYQSYDFVYGVVYDLAAYPDATLAKIDFHHASWGTVGIWDYKVRVVDWTTYTEIAVLGPFQTTGDDKWEENVPLGNIMGFGGGQIGIMLEPMSNDPTDAYPCFSSDNIGPDGVSMYGALPDYSALGASTIGDFLQNLWILTNFADAPVVAPRQIPVTELQGMKRVANTPAPFTGFLTTNQSVAEGPLTIGDNATVLGYNVYRSVDDESNYIKLNTSLVTDTLYNDMNLPYDHDYFYYVTTVFDAIPTDCESDSSNVVDWRIITGIDPVKNGGISIYPNPATSFVNVKSDNTITSIEVLSFIGQAVYTNSNVDAKTTKINVSNLQSGVYFVKVTTTQGTKTVKITVTK